MFIQSVKTPNPNALKFFPGGQVMGDSVHDFITAEEADVSPMAAALFRIEGVMQVFYGSDFISVTKNEEADWTLIKPQIIMTIINYYGEDRSLFNSAEDAVGHDDAGGDPTCLKIVELLEQYVVPRLAADGGYVQFKGFKDGIVRLKLRGACASCPSSTMTLKHGVKSLLMAWIPEVVDVEPVY